MIEIKDIAPLVNEPSRIDEIRSLIMSEEIVILKEFIDPQWIEQVKNYLTDIGKKSLPNYEALHETTPNFHRLNRSDPRAFVKGCFHQFSFFPWNQDVFNFFEFLRFGFQIKNLVNGLPINRFLTESPEDGCTSRVIFGAFVELPSGEKVHTDQITEIGDLLLFNARTPHGVEMIDPNENSDWLSFRGRWVMLFATNKLNADKSIQDAIDLEPTKH